MQFLTSFPSGILGILGILGSVLNLISFINCQCPTLPSGACFIDCTHPIYRIVCEDISGSHLAKDIRTFTNTSQEFALTLWGSELTRLGSTILSPIYNQLVRLHLDNLLDLQYFPELKKTICLQTHPHCKQVERLYLQDTGIESLDNDFEETAEMAGLRNFTFRNGVIRFVKTGYFEMFPNLKVVQFLNVTFKMVQSWDVFRSAEPLDVLDFIGNDFSSLPDSDRRSLLERALLNANMANGGRLDFSDNNLFITEGCIRALDRLSNLRVLSLRNNKFNNFLNPIDAFKNFTELTTLDLSGTNAPKSFRMLAGLPKLQELRLANNGFGDMGTINIFAGLLTKKLRILDLSSNRLEVFPAGLDYIGESVLELDFRDNNIDFDAVEDEQISSVTFSSFPNLLRFHLAQNHLTSFNASKLTPLAKLEQLDLSCNSFTNITKDYFYGLPDSLWMLNFSLCVDGIKTIKFDEDAFSTLPTIETLILREGALKSTIFSILNSIPHTKLSELDLSYNQISFLPRDKDLFQSMKNLKVLKLRSNLLQSVGKRGLAVFPSLEYLDLSRNEISSIGKEDFKELSTLVSLSLAGNHIIDVEAGSLQPLPNLREFYFQDNNFLDLESVLTGGGGELRHLGLQRLKLDCLPYTLFSRLVNLKWIYLNNSLPLFIDRGSFRNLKDEIDKNPPKPTMFPSVRTNWRICNDAYGPTDTDPLRIIVRPRNGGISQKLLANFPACYSTLRHDLKNVATNLICDGIPNFTNELAVDSMSPTQDEMYSEL